MHTPATPLMTIAIPAYNHERYITRCLMSVHAQTYPLLELVIIDDGSSDTTAAHITAFLEQHATRFARVHFNSRPNRGVSATSNECLAAAHGEWVHLLGSDDVLYPDKIATQWQAVQEWADAGLALVYADADVIDMDGSTIKFGAVAANRPPPVPQSRAFTTLLIKNPIPNPTVMLRRDAIMAIGGFDEQLLLEDWDCWLRLTTRYRIARVPKVLAGYRHHTHNTHHDQRKMLLAMMETFAKFLAEYDTQIPDDVLRNCQRINLRRLLRWSRRNQLRLWPALLKDRVLLPWHRPRAADFARYAEWLRQTQTATSRDAS